MAVSLVAAHRSGHRSRLVAVAPPGAVLAACLALTACGAGAGPPSPESPAVRSGETSAESSAESSPPEATAGEESARSADPAASASPPGPEYYANVQFGVEFPGVSMGIEGTPAGYPEDFIHLNEDGTDTVSVPAANGCTIETNMAMGEPAPADAFPADLNQAALDMALQSTGFVTTDDPETIEVGIGQRASALRVSGTAPSGDPVEMVAGGAVVEGLYSDYLWDYYFAVWTQCPVGGEPAAEMDEVLGHLWVALPIEPPYSGEG